MGYKISFAAGAKAPANPHPLEYNKIALVCEGGGQRGIFTAGLLDEFIRADFFPFQLMIGSSAGAQNLSAYACGQKGYGRHVITRFTTSPEFFNPLRFLRGGHLIDLDWLIEATSRDFPLDMARARQRLLGRELLLCACRSDDFQPVYFPALEDSWLDAIKASSAIPLFYRNGVELDGVRYLDGGVRDAIPVREAYRRGADLIVVIRTLPSGADEPPPWRRRMQRLLSQSRLKQVVDVVETHESSYLATQAFIDQPPDGLRILEIAPSTPLASKVLGSSVEALSRDYRIGRQYGRRFLKHIAPLLQPRQDSVKPRPADSIAA
ncbi:DUF6363 domain-containing protein [Neisseriaceae bacterium JH1-16]|nr:DUF6363 domain-containing protein [Neisseriaceae bacterium JH1-16]